jgi:DNA topoisomerase-2
LEEFYAKRLIFYGKRKEFLLSKLKRELEILQNKEKFILAVINDKISIKNVKKIELCKILEKLGLTPIRKITKIKSTKLAASKKEEK